MELVYFTLAGAMLYLASDWILRRIEQARGGEPLPQRSLVFFAIILTLSLGSFELIRRVTEPPPGLSSAPGGAAVPGAPTPPGAPDFSAPPAPAGPQ